MADMNASFHWADYLVFGFLLLLSTGIGVFFGCRDRKKQSTEEFLMAGRSMSIGPVALSMFATLMSSVAFIGDPVEVYYYGASYLAMIIGGVLGMIPIAQIFAPKFHEMHFVSAFELLEKAYNARIRKAASVTQVICMMFMMGVVLYAPSLALSQASNISVPIGIVTTAVVCTFYTTFGGMKAVLWADAIQMVVMFAGLFTLLICSIIKVGGLSKTWEIATMGDRLDLFIRMTPNPFERSNFWTYFVGGFFKVLIPFASTQLCIQRYCTLKKAKDATKVVYLNMPLFVLCIMTFFMVGIIMYVYWPCDPMVSKQISRMDQMIPLLVMQVLGFLPGIPGLFIACLFSASLSTLSSGQNSLSAVILSDMVMPWYKKKYRSEMSDRMGTIVAKSLAIAVGVITTGMAFVIMAMGGSMFVLTNKIIGMFGGPICGLFIAAILFPQINTLAISVGFLISAGICLWWGLGAIACNPPKEILPPRLDGCGGPLDSLAIFENDALFNQTFFNGTGAHFAPLAMAPQKEAALYPPEGVIPIITQAPMLLKPETCTGLAYLYRLSPVLYAPLGILLTVGVAWILSKLFKSCRKPDQKLQPQDVSEDEVDETTVFVRKQKDKNDNIMIDEGIMTDPVLVQNYSRIRYSFTPSLTGILINKNAFYEELKNPEKQEILWLALKESNL